MLNESKSAMNLLCPSWFYVCISCTLYSFSYRNLSVKDSFKMFYNLYSQNSIKSRLHAIQKLNKL